MAQMKLKIGLDAKRAVCNNTGLGNYSRYAINVLSAAYTDCSFNLYSPVKKENDRLEPLLLRENVELVVPKLLLNNGLTRAFWRTIDLPLDLRSDNIDIYHGLSNELPLTIKNVCPSVVTIHDLIWRRCREDYAAIDRRLYDFKYSRSAKIATRVIAISECTKRDLINDLGIDPEKIDIVYQGIDPIFANKPTSAQIMETRKRYGLPQKYIITVGTIQPRKNQLLAVEALPAIPEDISLLIVGSLAGAYGRKLVDRVCALRLGDRVQMLYKVPFTDLPALYAGAVASSYTSRYEGFGLPVVESLAMGTPVVACTGSCLEEAGGDGAVYINPDDVDAFAREATRIATDTVFHDKLARYGKQHIRRFSPESFARQTMDCYYKAIVSNG